MNTKRKLANLILVGGLAIATWAFAQTAFKADGIIESSHGGFKFPDNSVQTSAYNSSIEVYSQESNWFGENYVFNCNFSVPAGKLLVIERVSGYGAYDGSGEQEIVYMHVVGLTTNWFIPGTVNNSGGFVFDAQNVGYARDSFILYGESKGTPVSFADCFAFGRLYDAPDE